MTFTITKKTKKVGRTRKNNAIFRDLRLQACHKIVKGEEIFVGYGFTSDN